MVVFLVVFVDVGSVIVGGGRGDGRGVIAPSEYSLGRAISTSSVHGEDGVVEN